MIVVMSGFVFVICQTIENPDFRLWSHSSRCPGKPPSENKEVTQGAGICLSPGLSAENWAGSWESHSLSVDGFPALQGWG